MSKINVTPYERKVFWGIAMPKLFLYQCEIMMATHTFSEDDNFRMEFPIEREYTEHEMETGVLRQQRFGFRLIVEFSILPNIANRRLMKILRMLTYADKIVLRPHDGEMRNPITNDFDFEMVLDGNFDPRYVEGKWIGHTIEMRLKSKDLFSEPPQDGGLIQLVLATKQGVAGVESADPRTSLTYPNEKLLYGGWEVSEDAMKLVAFVETTPSGWLVDERGDPSIRAAEI